MKNDKIYLVLILILLATAGCTSSAVPTPATPVPTDTTNTAVTPTLADTTNEPTAPVGETPAAPAASPTAVPNSADLKTTVEADLPLNAFDDIRVTSLYAPTGERPLWVVHSLGSRNYEVEPLPGHFLAIYTYENGRWVELARQVLDAGAETEPVPPDIIPEQGVNQVDVAPNDVWLAVDGIVGAHGGTFHLLRFDGDALHVETAASSASPGIGHLEDLNGDDAPELILRLHDHYVFCYACGVRLLNFQVFTWDAAQQHLQELRIQPLPEAQQSHPAYQPANRAVGLAQADLWSQALTQIEAAQQIAANAAEPIDDTILAWNATLIRYYHQAWVAELSHSPYLLLTNVFFGDYAAALDIMRTVASDQIFSPSTPLIQGTAAEGNEQWLADYILRQTNAALAVQPDLAAAYYLRAWAAYLVNPADPQIAADLQQAAVLDPEEPLFAQASAPAAARIRFTAGATAATVKGQLQPQGIDVYVLAAQAGQQMSVQLSTADENARVTVRDGQGDFLTGQVTPTFWQGELSQNGDYVIRVLAGETAVDYTLQIIIPSRINFEPGATSATVAGNVAAYESDDYILGAQAGQTMGVTIDSPNDNVLLTIVGADGIPLTNGLMSGAMSWRGQLPATQDYTIRAIGTAEATTYTLMVSIE